MTDLVEERLSTAARRWQAEQPPPPAVPLARLDQPLPRRRLPWRPALAAAAAAIVVGGGAVAVSRAVGDDHAAPGDTGSPSPQVHRVAQVVPWRDLKAQHLRIAHRVHGRMVTPFDNLLAGGTIRGHVHPGDVLRFTVYLESPTDVSLDPCPDYSIAFGASRSHSWQLNCAQVPFRQASHITGRKVKPASGVVRLHAGRWHPVLPARTPVRFEMRVKVPDAPGRQKVLWVLDGPSAMPGFYGIVHVSRP